MAIFYKHIKGINESSEPNNYTYSYVEWTNQQPKLKTQEIKNNIAGEIQDKGNFITSEGDQTINGTLKINDLQLGTDWQIINNSPQLIIGLQNLETIESATRISLFGDDYYSFAAERFDINTIGTFTQPINFTAAGTDIFSATFQNIKVNNKTESLYFNATSDKRAKENIELLTASALDYIDSLKFYSFNYKNTDEATLGIIAQDIVDKPYNNINFVNNVKASGKNNDYMTIKESKLVYVSLKAIQELQNEIKNLKNEIQELKRKDLK